MASASLLGKPKKGTVTETLVIGGGPAGIAAAWELASSGIRVYLVEREATIGGHAATFCCKATETCNRCSVCVVSEKILEVAAHPRISLLTNTEVTAITGRLGDFSVSVTQKPRFADVEKCTACGICAGLCPTKAIHLPGPNAIPHTYVIDQALCLRSQGKECNICMENCPPRAIDFGQMPRETKLNVETIIVAAGCDAFDAKEKILLGYGTFPNVLSGLDLEKKFNTEGRITLPSNGKQPQNVAFIQCVGSREEHLGRGYCSQVCCKYAMRFAKLLQYQNPETKVTIFYIDLQTAGKGFGEFYEECKKTIRFVRGIPVTVSEVSPDELEVKYEDIGQGKVVKEKYDLVVLSVGIVPQQDSPALAQALGIDLGDYGFFATTNSLDAIGTKVEGIFLAGTCHRPMDIAESIADGIKAASRVIQAIAVRP